MENGKIVFGNGALWAIALYLVSMIGVGYYARIRRKGNTMADFYLAGRSLGMVVLFLTLYATQYSGNTLFGYTGKSYLIGFEWTVSVLFMFSIIVGYFAAGGHAVIAESMISNSRSRHGNSSSSGGSSWKRSID